MTSDNECRGAEKCTTVLLSALVANVPEVLSVPSMLYSTFKKSIPTYRCRHQDSEAVPGMCLVSHPGEFMVILMIV